MSALPSTSDLRRRTLKVRFVPIADHDQPGRPRRTVLRVVGERPCVAFGHPAGSQPVSRATPPTRCRIAPRGRAMGTPGQSRIERRLTAILAADIAGYSRLMGVDEVGTAR